VPRSHLVHLSDASTEKIDLSELTMKMSGQCSHQRVVDVNLCIVFSRAKDISDGASQSSSHNMLASS